MKNTYQQFVHHFAALLEDATCITSKMASRQPSPPPIDDPVAMIFAPHPDDECIMGALPLRLKKEYGVKIISVAVTLGSNVDRRKERVRELHSACGVLDFEPVLLGENGREKVTLDTRKNAPELWNAHVTECVECIQLHTPDIIFIPHDNDFHPTHIGTHYLVMDALSRCEETYSCIIIETEDWHPMLVPNIMVETCIDDVVTLVTALGCHTGEVARSPYHVRLPAWMTDNVRRGGEIMNVPGAEPPAFTFAVLYRAKLWHGANTVLFPDSSAFVGVEDSLDFLFSPLV